MEGYANRKPKAVDAEGRVLFSVRIPKGLRKRLRLLAVEKDTTIGRLVGEALSEALARVRKSAGGKKKAKVYVLRRSHSEQRQ